MAIRIRPAESRDCPAIRRVARQSWEGVYEDILGSDGIECGLQTWYEPERVADTIRNDVTFVAIGDEAVVGYTFGTVDGDSSELTALYVHPDCWGKGVGGQLLTRVLAGFSDRGARSVTARVFTENDRALDFFRANEFERTGHETVPVTANTSAEMLVLQRTVPVSESNGDRE